MKPSRLSQSSAKCLMLFIILFVIGRYEYPKSVSTSLKCTNEAGSYNYLRSLCNRPSRAEASVSMKSARGTDFPDPTSVKKLLWRAALSSWFWKPPGERLWSNRKAFQQASAIPIPAPANPKQIIYFIYKQCSALLDLRRPSVFLGEREHDLRSFSNLPQQTSMHWITWSNTRLNLGKVGKATSNQPNWVFSQISTRWIMLSLTNSKHLERTKMSCHSEYRLFFNVVPASLKPFVLISSFSSCLREWASASIPWGPASQLSVSCCYVLTCRILTCLRPFDSSMNP